MKSFDPDLEVHSAGTHPASRVHPKAVAVMHEVGVDLRGAFPKSVEEFLKQPFDYVITVCDDANETCPAFTGRVKKRVHIGFDDPARAAGSEAHVLGEFRRIRDEIQREFHGFYIRSIAAEKNATGR